MSTLNFLLGSALGRYPLASAGLCGEQRTYKGRIPPPHERSAGRGFLTKTPRYRVKKNRKTERTLAELDDF